MPSNRKKPVELPNDKKLIDLWIKLEDPSQTSIKTFKELFRVPTKRRKIGETASNLVPFREYPLQTKQRETYERQWAEGKGGQIAAGKGRQEGQSTDGGCSINERFHRGGGGTANVFSYDTDATKELLRLFHSFKKQTPPFVFTHIIPYVRGITKSVTEIGAEWRRDSAMQLELAFIDGSTSMIQCLTAGDKSSGAGSSPRWLLWDEFPKWKPEVKRDPTSMSEGWQSAPGNFWIVQGTGMGQDEYAEFFMRVWSGEDDSGFTAIFPDRGWLGHPDRNEAFEDEKARAKFMERVGKDKSYGIKDEEMLLRAGATPEELQWRRRKIASIAIKWDLQLFRREYPLVPSDMFESSARTVFAGQLEILKSHEIPAQARERRATAGELDLSENGTVKFTPAPHGAVLVFEAPEPDVDYCFGCDPSSGKVKTASTNKEADFTHASFAPVIASPSPCVARLRGHLTQRIAAAELFKLCCWYNGARGFVESNMGTTIIEFMKDMEHGIWSGVDFLLTQDQDATAIRNGLDHAYGYFTSVKTRESIIASVESVLVEAGLYDAERGTPFDPMEIMEALVFERDEKGRAEAARGHDDALFALGLRELARKKLLSMGDLQLQSVIRKKAPDDPLTLWYMGQMLQARKKKHEGASPLGRAF